MGEPGHRRHPGQVPAVALDLDGCHGDVEGVASGAPQDAGRVEVGDVHVAHARGPATKEGPECLQVARSGWVIS